LAKAEEDELVLLLLAVLLLLLLLLADEPFVVTDKPLVGVSDGE